MKVPVLVVHKKKKKKGGGVSAFTSQVLRIAMQFKGLEHRGKLSPTQPARIIEEKAVDEILHDGRIF